MCARARQGVGRSFARAHQRSIRGLGKVHPRKRDRESERERRKLRGREKDRGGERESGEMVGPGL